MFAIAFAIRCSAIRAFLFETHPHQKFSAFFSPSVSINNPRGVNGERQRSRSESFRGERLRIIRCQKEQNFTDATETKTELNQSRDVKTAVATLKGSLKN
jgi:hypothetical protein